MTVLLPLLLVAAADTGTGSRAVPIDPGSWFITTDYPTDASNRGVQGDVAFRVAVDAGGRADACGVLSSSGSQALDIATCDIVLAHARFTPAIGRDGKPIRSTYSSMVRWLLPDSTSPWKSSVSFVHNEIGASGAVTRCTEGSAGEEPQGKCSLFGQANVLAAISKLPLSRFRSIEMRQVQEASGAPAVPDPLPPGAARTILARWTLTIDPAGFIAGCHKDQDDLPTGILPDLCDPWVLPKAYHYPPSPSATPRTVHTTIEFVTQSR